MTFLASHQILIYGPELDAESSYSANKYLNLLVKHTIYDLEVV